MKKLITFLFLLFLYDTAFSQQAEPVELRNKEVPEDSERPLTKEPGEPGNHKITGKFYGYWDSRYTPADAPANVWKDWAGTVKEFSSRGKVIPMISGFAHDDRQSKIDSRINNYKTHVHGIGPEGIEFVLLHDEPYYKNFEVEQLERIVDSAKQNMGTQYKYAFTFARGNVRKSAVELPQNVDLVGLNFYPFYYQEYYPKRYITTKQQFFDFLTETVNIVRKKAPQAEIFLVGQAIQDDGEKYRYPPLESPGWYVEFLQANEDVVGLLWFEWRGRHSWEGIESMPDLYEKQKEAFKKLSKHN